MTHEQRIALWDAVNMVVAASGGNVANTSVARQKAVVEVERAVDEIAVRVTAPPWLSDAAEALGEVRPDDGAPLALNWTQVIQRILDLREDQDTLLQISGIVNSALNGESPLDREQRATKALHLVAQALGRPF
jgi:hypothetical protein